MGITFTLDHARRRLDARADGPITFAEVLRHLDEEAAHGGLAYPEVMDARTAEVVFTPAEVRLIVARLRDLGRAHALGPTAVMVGNDYAYGMLRMLEMLVEEVADVRPFRDPAAAEEWLRERPDRPPAGATPP